MDNQQEKEVKALVESNAKSKRMQLNLEDTKVVINVNFDIL